MPFNRKRSFYVSYKWVSDIRNGYGSAVVTITGKLTATAIKTMKETIDKDNKENGFSCIIISIVELEK